jgi:transposase
MLYLPHQNNRRNAIMMGRQKGKQGSLFYNFCLEDRVRSDHPLRKVAGIVDFDFIYGEVKDKYGTNGNVSVPPPVILKLMLLVVFYNVRSERELMSTLPERLDWLWFLGYDLDSDIPHHSVLSKARKRWGVGVFKNLFERIVWQCVEAGLIDGKKIFMDSSLVDADASTNSVIDTKNLKHRLKKNYQQLEARLEEKTESTRASGAYSKVNKRYISSTDPDAAIVRRGKPKLRHQVHRAVDGEHEIITATSVTPGDVNEAHEMIALVDQHEELTEVKVDTVVADSKYGTIENYLACRDRNLKAHIPDLHRAKGTKQNIFGQDQFQYDPENDVYHCPAGNVLKRRALHTKRQSIDYGCPRKICADCELREQCTKNKAGRTIKRHLRQEELDQMRQESSSPTAKKDIKTRQHLMERSFARGERLGIKRARWRGLWRMEIQEYLTCAIQNIQVLISRGGPVKEAVVNAVRVKTKAVLSRTRMHLWLPFERSFLRLGKSLAETFDISNAACLD